VAYLRNRVLILTFLLAFTISGPSTVSSTGSFVELSFKEKKQILTEVALKYGIPPEILKAIADVESKMMQFNDGHPIISDDGGIGIMQITDRDIPNINYARLEYDTEYNIEVGARILVQKYFDYQQDSIIPKINDGSTDIIENWYFAVMAYNGLSSNNDPNKETAYQELVFKRIKDKSFVNLADFPKGEMERVFSNPVFKWSGANTRSTQLFNEGDNVIVLNDHVNPHTYNYGNLRSTIGTSGEVIFQTPYYTNLKIVGGPYDDGAMDNHFVFYKVQGDGITGYIASSNLRNVDRNTKFEMWNSTKEIVPKDKEWSITFNTLLDSTSVNPRNIYIIDEDGNGVRAYVTLNNTGTIVKVKPKESFKPRKTYTLYIKNIVSASNQLMSKPISKTFSIYDDKKARY
jgi:hypothetical protein